MNTGETLSWIVGVLRKHKIPFVVSGGLAARLYGGTRPLYDIDIDIPLECFSKLGADVAQFITFGPARHISDQWDLYLCTLNHHGQPVDLSGAEDCKIRPQSAAQWFHYPVDLSKHELIAYDGLELPVIPKAELIAYKKILGRDTDLADIAELLNTP